MPVPAIARRRRSKPPLTKAGRWCRRQQSKRSAPACERLRFLDFRLVASLNGKPNSTADQMRGGAFPENALTALQRALGLDDRGGEGGRCLAPEGLDLLEAFLFAAHLDIVGIDVLAETRDPVGAERVAAGDDAAAVLDAYGHFGVGNRVPAGVAHEAEISRTLVLGLVVVPEGRTAGPDRGRQCAGDCQSHAHAQTRMSGQESHAERPPAGCPRSPAARPERPGAQL